MNQPRYSDDGQFYWNGQVWVPIAEHQVPQLDRTAEKCFYEGCQAPGWFSCVNCKQVFCSDHSTTAFDPWKGTIQDQKQCLFDNARLLAHARRLQSRKKVNWIAWAVIVLGIVLLISEPSRNLGYALIVIGIVYRLLLMYQRYKSDSEPDRRLLNDREFQRREAANKELS